MSNKGTLEPNQIIKDWQHLPIIGNYCTNYCQLLVIIGNNWRDLFMLKIIANPPARGGQKLFVRK